MLLHRCLFFFCQFFSEEALFWRILFSVSVSFVTYFQRRIPLGSVSFAFVRFLLRIPKVLLMTETAGYPFETCMICKPGRWFGCEPWDVSSLSASFVLVIQWSACSIGFLAISFFSPNACYMFSAMVVQRKCHHFFGLYPKKRFSLESMNSGMLPCCQPSLF